MLLHTPRSHLTMKTHQAALLALTAAALTAAWRLGLTTLPFTLLLPSTPTSSDTERLAFFSRAWGECLRCEEEYGYEEEEEEERGVRGVGEVCGGGEEGVWERVVVGKRVGRMEAECLQGLLRGLSRTQVCALACEQFGSSAIPSLMKSFSSLPAVSAMAATFLPPLSSLPHLITTHPHNNNTTTTNNNNTTTCPHPTATLCRLYAIKLRAPCLYDNDNDRDVFINAYARMNVEEDRLKSGSDVYAMKRVREAMRPVRESVARHVGLDAPCARRFKEIVEEGVCCCGCGTVVGDDGEADVHHAETAVLARLAVRAVGPEYRQRGAPAALHTPGGCTRCLHHAK
eukprot:jgi/Chlat1/3174/Chrsp22S03454